MTHTLTLPHAARTYRVLDEVAAERARQHALVAAREINDWSNPGNSLHGGFEDLNEAVAQAAEGLAILAQVGGPAHRLLLNELRSELIQVAAVAVAIAESLTPAESSKFKVQSSELEVPPRTSDAVLTPPDLQPEDLNE
jgi:hypothetical protein